MFGDDHRIERIIKEAKKNVKLVPTITRREDVEKEVELMLKGTPAGHIVAIINENHDERTKVTMNQVFKDVSVALRIWRERFVTNLDLILAREMERLDNLEKTYWDAWEKSTQPMKTDYEFHEITEGIGEEGRAKAKTTGSHKEVTTYGDPQFLAGIERVIALRYKLLGIGQTRTVNINWRQEAAKAGIDPDNVIDAVVSQLVDTAIQKDENLLEDGSDE